MKHTGNITVEYEMTTYTATEMQGSVELCVVVTSHRDGAPRMFTLQATSSDGTAGSDATYVYTYSCICVQ